jgi:translation initiation factor 3 subunit C
MIYDLHYCFGTVFAYSAYYEALSLDQLCDMFALERNAVNSLVSKMIISDELFASWDQPTGSIVMHKKERSRLHHLALQFSDIIGKLVETNEKGWDNKYGGYGYRDQSKQGGKWGNQQGGGRMGGDRRDGDNRRDGQDRRDGEKREWKDNRGDWKDNRGDWKDNRGDWKDNREKGGWKDGGRRDEGKKW